MVLQIRVRSTAVPDQSLLEFNPYQDVIAAFFTQPELKNWAPKDLFPRAGGQTVSQDWTFRIDDLGHVRGSTTRGPLPVPAPAARAD